MISFYGKCNDLRGVWWGELGGQGHVADCGPGVCMGRGHVAGHSPGMNTKEGVLSQHHDHLGLHSPGPACARFPIP